MTPTQALADLRHTYLQLMRGAVKEPQELARALLGPAIEALEIDAQRIAEALAVESLPAIADPSHDTAFRIIALRNMVWNLETQTAELRARLDAATIATTPARANGPSSVQDALERFWEHGETLHNGGNPNTLSEALARCEQLFVDGMFLANMVNAKAGTR